MTEDEMVAQNHQQECEHGPEDGEGQQAWAAAVHGFTESDTTDGLNNSRVFKCESATSVSPKQRENTYLHLLCLEYRLAFQSDQGNLGAPCGMASGQHDLPGGQPGVVLLPPPRASQGKAAGVCG